MAKSWNYPIKGKRPLWYTEIENLYADKVKAENSRHTSEIAKIEVERQIAAGYAAKKSVKEFYKAMQALAKSRVSDPNTGKVTFKDKYAAEIDADCNNLHYLSDWVVGRKEVVDEIWFIAKHGPEVDWFTAATTGDDYHFDELPPKKKAKFLAEYEAIWLALAVWSEFNVNDNLGHLKRFVISKQKFDKKWLKPVAAGEV